MKKTIFTISAILAAGQIFAADIQPFSQPKFDALQKDGKPVLVDVYADWCPVCKRQQTVLEPMLKEPQFKDMTVLKLNFDTQKQHLKQFNVSRQSTLVLFNKGKEVRRGTGETNMNRLRQFVSLPH